VGFRYYKRVNLGGGFHLNFSKTGVGISDGVPGARYSVHSSGRTVKTVGLPGTGLYYRKDTYAKGSHSRSTSLPSTSTGSGLGTSSTFESVLVRPIADRVSVRYRFVLRRGARLEVIEQQIFMDLDEQGRIKALDLLCSGFRPADG
jgi:hypothetical protein